MPLPERLFRVDEVAAYLAVNRSTIYRLLKKGVLTGVKVGSDWRFRRETVERYVTNGELLAD